MNLSFKQQINGKSNYFIQRIWNGLHKELGDDYFQLYDTFLNQHHELFERGWDDDFHDVVMPKIHTIREDAKGRWGYNNDIHFVINNRSPQRFQFAPVIKVKSIQKIEIIWFESKHPVEGNYAVHNPKENLFALIKIDGRQLGHHTMHDIAVNDGFDNVDDFFLYFNKSGKYNLIHWTDKKY